MSVAIKIEDLQAELARFVERHGIERSRIIKRTIAGSVHSGPIIGNFLRRKGFPGLASDEGLTYFVEHCP